MPGHYCLKAICGSIAEVEGLPEPTVLLFPWPSWQPLTENRGVILEFFVFLLFFLLFPSFFSFFCCFYLSCPVLFESFLSRDCKQYSTTRRHSVFTAKSDKSRARQGLAEPLLHILIGRWRFLACICASLCCLGPSLGPSQFWRGNLRGNLWRVIRNLPCHPPHDLPERERLGR